MDASANPEALFRKNSRSFSLAARLFDPRDQLAVARIYRFCRYLDDLADDTQEGDAESLDRARLRLTRKLDFHADSVEADWLRLAEERGMPLDPALTLIAALREDCGARSIKSADALVRFAYGVAGTVGQMLRYVIDAHDPRADPFAIDLGIGLQLTNVVRDISEDADRGRFYLPADWAEPAVIERALAGDDSAASVVDQAVHRTLALSEQYYQSARRGFAYIPHRNRRVIFLAAALYEAIGQKLLRSGSGSWRQRTVVGAAEKLAVVVRSLRDYQGWQSTTWSENPEPDHDAALHAALDQVRSQDRKPANLGIP